MFQLLHGWQTAKKLSFVTMFAVLSPFIMPLQEQNQMIVVQPDETYVEVSEKNGSGLIPMTDPAVISNMVDHFYTSELFGIAATEEKKPEREEIYQGETSPVDKEIPLDLFPCYYQPTREEYEMMLFCVDHETRSGSLKHRILISQVILNRVQGPKFGSTMEEVLMKKGQFDVMVSWENRGDWVPKEDTVTAVNMVLSGTSQNFANGAVYFCNPYIVGEGNWFDTSLQVVCEMEGHRFYKPY